MTVLSKSFIPCEPDFGHYKSFKSLSYKGGSVSEFTSCKLSKQGPVLGPGIRREMRGNWARFGALSFVVASVGLNTSAQTVYNVPVGSLAVLPEGSTRELEAPFTEIQLPESAKESNDPEVANLQGANDTTFVSFDDSFSAILGDSPQLKLLAEKDYPFAHEGAVYLPQTNEVRTAADLVFLWTCCHFYCVKCVHSAPVWCASQAHSSFVFMPGGAIFHQLWMSVERHVMSILLGTVFWL